MPTLEESRRAWEGQRTRGEFDTLVFPLRLQYQALRMKLDAYLLKRLLTPKQWGEVQHLQGRIKGTAEAIQALDRLSKPAVEEQPRARPSLDA